MGKVVLVQLDPSISKRLRDELSESIQGNVEELPASAAVVSMLRQGRTEVDAVILGSKVDHPIQLAQGIHSVRKDVSVIILADPERYEPFCRTLKFTPFLGDSVFCRSASEDTGSLADQVNQLVRRAEKRRQHHDTMAVVRLQLLRPVEPARGVLAQPAYFERLLNAAPIGVVAVDSAARILTWNPKASEQLECTERESLGTSILEFFAEDSVRMAELIRSLTGESAEPGTVVEVFRRTASNGDKQVIEVTGASVEGSNGDLAALLLLQDITERTLAISHLEEALRARDEFISIASHELNTPLTSLRLQAQLLKRLLDSNDYRTINEKLSQIVERADRQVSRLARLIRDMLDISRIVHRKLEMTFSEVDLVALASEVAERFSEQLKQAGCVLEFRGSGPIRLKGDPDRLEQVIVNLISNAIKYGTGKPIIVEVGTAGEKVFLHVEDHGIGIAPENQQRIFQRFERAVSASEISGLGLGLYIVSHIVEAHRGRISVQSEPGKGSRFTVELPLLDS